MYPDGAYSEAGERLAQPSEHWNGPPNWCDCKWVRYPVEGEIPHIVEPLDEFYQKFFHKSFEEFKQALEGMG